MLRAQLGEAGRGEDAVEGQRALDSQRAHKREARRVDERVLALVVAPKPAQRLGLELL
jgi:hypothetical protein